MLKEDKLAVMEAYDQCSFDPVRIGQQATVPPCQPRIRAVLFDLDGTLTDRPRSIATVAQSFVVAFADRLESVAVDPICREMLAADGHGYRPRGQFLAQLRDSIRWRERPDIEEITSFWQREFPLCTVEAEGMMTTLRSLHAQGLKLGIVSNGSTRVQNAKIDQLGLRPLLTTAMISETAGVKKPDRRIFEMALDELGLPPSDVAFVGDHPANDVLAAQAMGMTGIWLRSGIDWPADLPPPRLTVLRLTDVRSLLPAT